MSTSNNPQAHPCRLSSARAARRRSSNASKRPRAPLPHRHVCSDPASLTSARCGPEPAMVSTRKRAQLHPSRVCFFLPGGSSVRRASLGRCGYPAPLGASPDIVGPPPPTGVRITVQITGGASRLAMIRVPTPARPSSQNRAGSRRRGPAKPLWHAVEGCPRPRPTRAVSVAWI